MNPRPAALPACLAAMLLAAGQPAAARSLDTAARSPDAVARSAAPRPAAAAKQKPIVIDAAFSQVDYKTDTVVFRNVAVSQGDTRVTADGARATGVSFTDSRWTFEGNVLIALPPRGTLRSDRAIVEFRGNVIARATITGKPAQFEQARADSRGPARGHADRIVYDAASDSIRLTGDARLSNEHNVEISGPVLVYDIRNERLEAASSGERRRVHITVTAHTPPKSGQASAGEGPRR